LIGIGAGLFIQASFSVAQAKVPHERMADSAGFISLAQNLGIVLALAISGSIFQNKAVDGLLPILPGIPVDSVRGAIAGTSSSVLQQLPADIRLKVLDVIISAIGATYILVIVAGAMTIVGSLFMSVSRRNTEPISQGTIESMTLTLCDLA
jgi:hypothetical protein